MNDKSNQLLAQVSPALAAKIVNAAALMLAGKGIEIRVIQGLRTTSQQDALYAQGRTLPGKVVTNARGGQSSHNFGLAVDVVPGVAGLATWTPQWSARAPEFVAMVTALKRQGLAWGGDWVHIPGDFDHFYLANSPATPTDAMRADLATGLPLVFSRCDAGAYTEV
jgi:peptidoglycan L-alanyl-D-glutamate endopeptidase CwlK